MQFNDTTNKAGMIQMIEKTLGLNYGAISGNSSELAYITNLINMWVGKIGNIIWQVSGNWYFDDSNQTDLPIQWTNLVALQGNYLLPTDLLAIKKVEVMDTNGDYNELTLLPQNDSRLRNKQFQETSGLPTHYYLIGRNLFIYPKPASSSVTLSKGLRVTADREMEYFAVSETTKELGISPSDLHWIPVYGVVLHEAGIKGKMDIATTAKEMLYSDKGLLDQLKKHYANRNEDEKIIMKPAFANETFE